MSYTPEKQRTYGKAYRHFYYRTYPERIKAQSKAYRMLYPERHKRYVEIWRKRNPKKYLDGLKKQYNKNKLAYSLYAMFQTIMKKDGRWF
jgi:hypothetical protein